MTFNIASPSNINPVQWQQSQGYARNICARVFRDGGTPADAMAAFGLDASDAPADWSTVVDRIALAMSKTPARKAA